MPVVNVLKPEFLNQVATCMDKDPLDKENALALLQAVNAALTGLYLEGTLETTLDDMLLDLEDAIKEDNEDDKPGDNGFPRYEDDPFRLNGGY